MDDHESWQAVTEAKKTRRGRKEKEMKGGGKEKSRLEEWLESYGISRATREVKGAEQHIKRLREGTSEREGETSKFQLGVR